MPIVSVDQAARIIREGGVVGFPTETVFGLAADPFQRAAVSKISEMKSRDLGSGIPLIAANSEIVARLAADSPISTEREALQREFWPGPLTIVFDVTSEVTERLAPEVFGPQQSVAVRVSSHPVAQSLAARSGGLLTATSANTRGAPPARQPIEVLRYFPDLPVVENIPDAPESELPSTIIDVRSQPFRILREGAIRRENLQWYLGS